MARVTVEEVQALVGCEAPDWQILAFIGDASEWVDNYLVGHCPGLDAGKLPIIEKYLAAHLASVATPGAVGVLTSAARQDIRETYAAPGQGQESRYIGVAASFDPCGIVEEFWIGARKRFRAVVGRGYDRRRTA